MNDTPTAGFSPAKRYRPRLAWVSTLISKNFYSTAFAPWRNFYKINELLIMVNKKKNILFRFLITNYNNPKGDSILLLPIIPLFLLPIRYLGRNPLIYIICIIGLLLFDHFESKWINNFMERNGVDGPDAANKYRKIYKLSAFIMILCYLLLLSITIVLFLLLFC